MGTGRPICADTGGRIDSTADAKAVDVNRVAIVVGGGQAVLSDLVQADHLVTTCGIDATYLIINDMIGYLHRPCIAVTLHPQKAESWLAQRKCAGAPAPSQVWAHHKGQFAAVTNVTSDWRGSSGLFAVKVARELGFIRIILCGVPMQAEEKHFVRKVRWASCDSFRIGWQKHRAEIAPFVRSCGGWTAELFGRPDETFLSALQEKPAA